MIQRLTRGLTTAGRRVGKLSDNIGWALLQLVLYAKFRAWPDWGTVWRTLRGEENDAPDSG